MQFICAPVQGALSDRLGRRPVILLSNFGLALNYLLMALAPNLSVLLIGRLISGASAASMSVGGAYIADVMPPGRRSIGFGRINVAIGIGLVLGPAMGGVLGAHNPRLPFWVAAGLSLLPWHANRGQSEFRAADRSAGAGIRLTNRQRL
ncbi:MAG TPA: MFS transporter [Acetobacteraceae bacterium]|jgi:MFS transporter, DHA1 family, tetracycline resistance protein|nr:MFS transporter [Acetobacteraceae bacterium]